jgi:hypothetical protein
LFGVGTHAVFIPSGQKGRRLERWGYVTAVMDAARLASAQNRRWLQSRVRVSPVVGSGARPLCLSRMPLALFVGSRQYQSVLLAGQARV